MDSHMNEAQSPELYDHYAEWKGWSHSFSCSPEMAAYFAGELGGADITGRHILEIGFGNGEFIDFARARGAIVYGAELGDAALEAARQQGITIVPADFENEADKWSAQFDLIAAFDVFEHLTPDQIVQKLRAIDVMLKPEGKVLLRFPNGQSPFGLAPQHADATHVTALSLAKIEQYLVGTQLTPITYRGVARANGGSLSRRLVRRVRYALRDCHMALIRFLYATDVELEPVVTLIAVKKDVAKMTAPITKAEE